MKKISNVFWISVVIVVLRLSFGAFAPESFEASDKQYEELHHFIIRLVLFTLCHWNCTVLPVLYRQSDGANYAWEAG